MSLSPLQLKHYHFTALSLKARADFAPALLDSSGEPYPSMADIDLVPEITLSEPEDDATQHFVVTLAIAHEPVADSSFPYAFAAAVEGIFALEHDGPLEERKRLVVANGASMLFSAIREQLLALSARHKFGPMLLPSLCFTDLQPT